MQLNANFIHVTILELAFSTNDVNVRHIPATNACQLPTVDKTDLSDHIIISETLAKSILFRLIVSEKKLLANV